MSSSGIWWQKHQQPHSTNASMDRIVDIVSRYPQISGVEAAEVVKFLKRGRYAEINQLTSDDSVRRQLDIFMRGHRYEFRLDPTSVVTALALLPTFVAITWLLWRSIG